MIILIQMVLFCLLFTAMVMYAVSGGAIDGLYFYPKAVQERAIDIGLITKETMQKKRKVFMTEFYIVMLTALVLIIGLWNRVSDFKTAYLQALFYTQGDYGLFQSVNPAIQKTFDNEEWVMKAMEAQGFVRDDQGVFQVPIEGKLLMEIPSEMIPKCPDDGSDMTMNLRADDSFVEDEGWHRASAAYSDFIRRHENLHVLYLELGVGANTPVIIKYPFWQMTLANEKTVYACLNYGESFCPEKIADRSICIDGDIGEVFETQISK